MVCGKRPGWQPKTKGADEVTVRVASEFILSYNWYEYRCLGIDGIDRKESVKERGFQKSVVVKTRSSL